MWCDGYSFLFECLSVRLYLLLFQRRRGIVLSSVGREIETSIPTSLPVVDHDVWLDLAEYYAEADGGAWGH